jgi:hypothetical protein
MDGAGFEETSKQDLLFECLFEVLHSRFRLLRPYVVSVVPKFHTLKFSTEIRTIR